MAVTGGKADRCAQNPKVDQIGLPLARSALGLRCNSVLSNPIVSAMAFSKLSSAVFLEPPLGLRHSRLRLARMSFIRR